MSTETLKCQSASENGFAYLSVFNSIYIEMLKCLRDFDHINS